MSYAAKQLLGNFVLEIVLGQDRSDGRDLVSIGEVRSLLVRLSVRLLEKHKMASQLAYQVVGHAQGRGGNAPVRGENA